MRRCPRCNKRFGFKLFHPETGIMYSDEFLSYGQTTCYRCPGSYLPNGEVVPKGYFDDYVMDISGKMRRKTDAERAGDWTAPVEDPALAQWEGGVYTTGTIHVPYVEWWKEHPMETKIDQDDLVSIYDLFAAVKAHPKYVFGTVFTEDDVPEERLESVLEAAKWGEEAITESGFDFIANVDIGPPPVDPTKEES